MQGSRYAFAPTPRHAFLFATIQSFESDFYGTVGVELSRRGHAISHVTVSRHCPRRSAIAVSRPSAYPDAIAELPPFDVAAERTRIESRYGLPSIRDVYRIDPASEGRAEDWCVRSTVRHFLALERLFDRVRPDVLVPEVGTELLRTVAHHVALARRIPTLFSSTRSSRRPLRPYVDTLDAPIVARDEVRPLNAEERQEVEGFIAEFTARREPIRAHRPVLATRRRLAQAREYIGARVGPDKDNEYLHPWRWTGEHVLGWGRALTARAFYRTPRPGRPYVYFPLHVTDDFKIKRVIPHCSDQAAIVELIAEALPPGYDLVLKEHPLSIGRNPLSFLRRVQRPSNVYIVPPHTSSHDLIESACRGGRDQLDGRSGSSAVCEAAFRRSGTRSTRATASHWTRPRSPSCASSFRPCSASSPIVRPSLGLLHAAMRRCRPGAPVLVDRSDENALLARAIARGGGAGDRGDATGCGSARGLRIMPGTTVIRTGRRALGSVGPRRYKRRRALSTARRAAKKIERIASSDRTIVAGPWIGGVGMELLYWIPFLNQLVSEHGVDPARVVAVSRGGAEPWYADVAGGYVDLLDHYTADEIRAWHEERLRHPDTESHIRVRGHDRAAFELAREQAGGGNTEWLHPVLAHRLFAPRWERGAPRRS